MTTELIKRLRYEPISSLDPEQIADALEAMQRELDAVKAENIAHKNSIAIFESQWKELQGELDAAKADIETLIDTANLAAEVTAKNLAARDLVIQQMREVLSERDQSSSTGWDWRRKQVLAIQPTTEHLDAYAAEAVAKVIPEVKEAPPLYPDESRQAQLQRWHYLCGWNDCVAAIRARSDIAAINALEK